MSTDRRGFLKLLGVGTAGAAAAVVVGKLPEIEEEQPEFELEGAMPIDSAEDMAESTGLSVEEASRWLPLFASTSPVGVVAFDDFRDYVIYDKPSMRLKYLIDVDTEPRRG